MEIGILILLIASLICIPFFECTSIGQKLMEYILKEWCGINLNEVED